jgi:sulfite reductase (ferredoxin)
MQNILITSIRNERTAELVERSRALGVALDGSPFQRGTASCTGSEYCKLAITETKLFSIRLAQELEERLPGFTDIVKLHVAGCPNSCGQHPIADVGLQGVLLNQNGTQVEGLDFFFG